MKLVSHISGDGFEISIDRSRYLREKITDIQDSETRRHLTQSLQSNEKEAMAEHNERLEARQEVLEDHNERLEEQLAKLRQLLHQVERSAVVQNNTHQQIPIERKSCSRNLSGSVV